MADERLATYAGQVQTEFMDSFETSPVPETPLKRLAKEGESLDGANTFREYIRPYIAPTRTTLTEFRSRTSANPLTSDPTKGGQIASTPMLNKHLDHTIESMFEFGFDVEGTSGIDAKFNTPDKVAARNRKTFDETRAQYEHEECARQLYYANEWLVPASATISAASAISAGTTFAISDADKASSGIAVGDLVKIGDSRIPDATGGAAATIDVALVKTVGADGSAGGSNSTITIEDDATKFPKASNYLTSPFFDNLKTALVAHDSGVRVQIDRPITTNVSQIDSVITDLQELMANNNCSAEGATVYVSPSIWYKLCASDTSLNKAPSLENDFLGKDILMNGGVYRYRGMNFITDNNALRRIYGGGTNGTGVTLAEERFYMYAFAANEAFGYGSLLQSQAMDKIPGTADLLHKFTYAEISGSFLSFAGSQKSFLVSCKL